MRVADAPLVEGAIAAGVMASTGAVADGVAPRRGGGANVRKL